MNVATAVRTLAQQDQRGRWVYTLRDLECLFHEDAPAALRASLRRLIAQGVLVRAAQGVYVYGLSAHLGSYTLERVAVALRRGFYSYVSLESALSAYGLISQMPIDRLTVMTTGRSGEYRTPFGAIEFTHTHRKIADVLAGMRSLTTDLHGSPLRMATCETALRDLRRVGRNLHLVEERGDAA